MKQKNVYWELCPRGWVHSKNPLHKRQFGQPLRNGLVSVNQYPHSNLRSTQGYLQFEEEQFKARNLLWLG